MEDGCFEYEMTRSNHGDDSSGIKNGVKEWLYMICHTMTDINTGEKYPDHTYRKAHIQANYLRTPCCVPRLA